MECAANIHSLSVEVLGHVLSWLGDEDLESAASVSRHWFDVINHHLLRRKRCAIMRPDADDFVPDWPLEQLSLVGFSGQQLVELENVCADVTSLHVSYLETSDRVLEDDHLTSLLTSCEHLENVSFKNVVPKQSTLQVLQRCGFHTLQTLNFQCQTTEMDQHEIEMFFEKLYFPEVKLIMKPCGSDSESHLYARYPFAHSNPLSSIHVPNNVTTLTLDCSGLSRNAYSFLSSCSDLQSVVLTNAFRMEDDAVEGLCKLPKLASVHISDAGRVTAQGWSTLFRHPQLSSMSLTRCAATLSDLVFSDMTAASHQLRIDLQNCKPITKEGFVSLLGASQQLYLTLDYNEKLLDNLVAAIDTHDLCSHLRHLDIAIQRVHATSESNSLHLNEIQKALASRSKQLNINLSYSELFTKVVYNTRPTSIST